MKKVANYFFDPDDVGVLITLIFAPACPVGRDGANFQL